MDDRRSRHALNCQRPCVVPFCNFPPSLGSVLVERGNPFTRPLASIHMGKKRRRIMEYLVVLALLGLWLVLQIWVLPKLGVPT